MKKYNLVYLTILFFLFFTIYSNAQTKINETQQKKYYDTYLIYQLDQSKGKIVGSKMLSLAQTPYEKSLAYLTLGRDRSDNGDFVKSVEFLQKSYDLSASVDSLDTQLDVLTNLIPSYRRAGLIVQSDEKLKLLKKLSEKESPYTSKIYQLLAEAKNADIDNDFCKSAKLKYEFIKILKPVSDIKDIDLRYRFSIYNQLCYVLIKCGKTDEAKKNMQVIDKMYAEINKENPIKLIEFYYMNKALLNQFDGNNDDAKEYFIKATDTAIKVSSKMVIRDIINERLKSDLDDDKEQLRLTKIVSEIYAHQTTITKTLVQKESENYNDIINKKENRNNTLIIITLVSIILLISGIFWYRKREKTLKSTYQRIINEIEIDNNKAEVEIVDNSSEEDSKLYINETTEKELLKNLLNFEKKKLFTTKGISSAQMSVMLKTNTKYLSFLLKKYRNNDFNNYINDARINYIINELHQNPQILNYKISVLAEMCGYASHSQFSSIFKEKKDISPSKFIDFLQKRAK